MTKCAKSGQSAWKIEYHIHIYIHQIAERSTMVLQPVQTPKNHAAINFTCKSLLLASEVQNKYIKITERKIQNSPTKKRPSCGFFYLCANCLIGSLSLSLPLPSYTYPMDIETICPSPSDLHLQRPESTSRFLFVSSLFSPINHAFPLRAISPNLISLSLSFCKSH